MAKHKKRRLRGYVTIDRSGGHPRFGFLKTLYGPVEGSDVLVGGAVGMVGAGVASMAVKKLTEVGADGSAPFVKDPFLVNVLGYISPLLGASALGYGAYRLSGRGATGKGRFVGAAAGGLAVVAFRFLQDKVPAFQEYVNIPRLSGVLVNNPRLRGVLVKNQRLAGVLVNNPKQRLAALVEHARQTNLRDAYQQ